MRIVRLQAAGHPQAVYGLEHTDGSVTLASGAPFSTSFADTGEAVEVERRLAPVEPTAIYGIGLNYAEHAAEGGREPPERPVVFMKTPSAAQHPGGPIVLPRRLRSERVDYEAELAVVIGRACKNVTREDALNHVLGFTCANDVSARDWQRQGGGGQWCRGKTFDTFAPLGPAIVTLDEFADPHDLSIACTVSGQRLQSSRTRDMIFNVPTLIEFLSASVTLTAGTVILTGTPAGVGFAQDPPRFLKPGDEVNVEIEGIGKLTNPVVEEDAEELDQWALATS